MNPVDWSRPFHTLLQLHTKSLCVLALQNSQFEASTSSRPQTVNFEALGHKAIYNSEGFSHVASSGMLLCGWICRSGTTFGRILSWTASHQNCNFWMFPETLIFTYFVIMTLAMNCSYISIFFRILWFYLIWWFFGYQTFDTHKILRIWLTEHVKLYKLHHFAFWSTV